VKQLDIPKAFDTIPYQAIGPALRTLGIPAAIIATVTNSYKDLLTNITHQGSSLLSTVLSSLDKKSFVGGLFCDLQKACDCVNHDILLAKMEFYGISGIANKLMKSYLNNRYQRTVIKDSEQ
jgi:hypothetical protein